MRSPSSTWDAAIDALGQDAQVLCRIKQGGTVLHRLALGWDRDLTYAGETWTAEPGASYQRLVTSDRDQGAALRIEDPANVWSARFAATDYIHAEVSAVVVSRAQIATTDAAIGEVMWIRNRQFGASELAYTFSLGLIVDLLGARLPLRTYSEHCPYAYRGSFCLSTDSGMCSKKLEGKNGCRTHFPSDKPKRFGGFPNRPSRLFLGLR